MAAVEDANDVPLSCEELQSAWALLLPEERVNAFRELDRINADTLFPALRAHDQVELLRGMTPKERRSCLRMLPPDEVADLVQATPIEERLQLLGELDDRARREVVGLLAYKDDEAGGIMNPRYTRLRPDLTVDEAIIYIRKQVRENPGTIYYAYVVDAEQKLIGVVSFRDLLSAKPDTHVREVMKTNVVQAPADMDQETVGRLFAKHGLIAIPVVDDEGHMKGVVTVDDIVDVVQQEATEDIQKLGGMEVMGFPYLEIPFRRMIRMRAGWLSALFLGELLTATAMSYFQDEIARAVVLALFVPLIISSGGNSGSQATTLVIRAMALGEVQLGDWWRVLRREILAGAALGTVLGTIGMLRILIWQAAFASYGEHYALVGLTVFLSLIGVVTFGSISGCMLPFILRRLGFDPASASAPFVATLVDVTGLVIYFSVASMILADLLRH